METKSLQDSVCEEDDCYRYNEEFVIFYNTTSLTF